jgi:SAM-dependent methyltransferase
MGISQLLQVPQFYSTFARLAGGNSRTEFVRQYVRARPEDRLLDIGCGPADILDDLPGGIDYTGFDSNPSYIENAQHRFGQRGRFICRQVSTALKEELSTVDVVLACGVLHHLDDAQAVELLSLAKAVLNDGGRLITIDGCIVPGQSRIARFLLDRDRGQFVRTEAAYLALASKVFGSFTSHVRHDLMRIPYTHLIIELRP